MKKLSKQDVFEMLQELDRASCVQEGDVTELDVQEKFGWGRYKAKNYLTKLVERKELIKLNVKGKRGVRTWVYRKK